MPHPISHPAGAARHAFEVVRPSSPAAARPVVAHIPHASTHIPADLRAAILLDDRSLDRELLRLTDWHTDELFSWAGEHGAIRFVNRLSRLVVDPERFADPTLEPMEARGQGVVYTLTTEGRPLRDPDAAARTMLIETFHRPYHAALERVVGEVVERFGVCTLLDCHSFATEPLPSELDQSRDRPDVCIGRDAVHTPPRLAASLMSAFRAEGLSVAFDTPFAGTMVPGAFHGHDRRVRSVMLEVRRGLYLDEATGERLPRFELVRAAIERAVAASGALD